MTAIDEWIFNVCERKALRHAVVTECEVVTLEDFRLIGRRVIDLSIEGILIQIWGDCPPLGTSVLVSLKLPRGQTWIDADGTIVRAVRGLRSSDPGSCLAVRFDAMATLDRAMLAGSLDSHPPPIPARKRRRDYASAVQRFASA